MTFNVDDPSVRPDPTREQCKMLNVHCMVYTANQANPSLIGRVLEALIDLLFISLDDLYKTAPFARTFAEFKHIKYICTYQQVVTVCLLLYGIKAKVAVPKFLARRIYQTVLLVSRMLMRQ
jgi:hypothetical protein